MAILATTLANIPRRMAKMDPPQTPESIAEAKAVRDAERAEVERLTGVRFTDDGPVPPVPRIVFAHCTRPNCLWVRGAKSSDEAFLKLEQHLRTKHGITAPDQVA